VLLVGDNKDGVSARKHILSELGCEIVVANCPIEALERASQGHFDLVVTEYRMPKMDGIELIRKLRGTNSSVRTVLISGIAEALGLSESNTGADAVIQKSAREVAELQRAATRLLGRTPRKGPGFHGGWRRRNSGAR
jgi:CheY-like chemotaxis protein